MTLELGKIRKSIEIGYKNPGAKHAWQACIDCGKERWVELRHGNPRSLRCYSCARSTAAIGKTSNNWKGGQFQIAIGYVFVLKPEHPKANYWGYVKRSRLVLEEKLGRYLLPGCEPHHKNEIKEDDTPDNLEEVPLGEHRALHRRGKRKCNSKN